MKRLFAPKTENMKDKDLQTKAKEYNNKVILYKSLQNECKTLLAYLSKIKDKKNLSETKFPDNKIGTPTQLKFLDTIPDRVTTEWGKQNSYKALVSSEIKNVKSIQTTFKKLEKSYHNMKKHVKDVDKIQSSKKPDKTKIDTLNSKISNEESAIRSIGEHSARNEYYRYTVVNSHYLTALKKKLESLN